MESSVAASRALRARGPIQSRGSERAKTPYRLTRPQLGFNPVTPFAAEGKRIEPPVSEPIAAKQSPAATATPEPLDDAPGQALASHGLRGGAIAGWCSPTAPSVSLSLPSNTAPALVSLRMTD